MNQNESIRLTECLLCMFNYLLLAIVALAILGVLFFSSYEYERNRGNIEDQECQSYGYEGSYDSVEPRCWGYDSQGERIIRDLKWIKRQE